jgi:hypothetical protein
VNLFSCVMYFGSPLPSPLCTTHSLHCSDGKMIRGIPDEVMLFMLLIMVNTTLSAAGYGVSSSMCPFEVTSDMVVDMTMSAACTTIVLGSKPYCEVKACRH